jgi:hypothetical protein
LRQHDTQNANAQSNPPLQEMLQKLHFLETIVEQTNAELHILENMLHRVLDG